MQCPLQSHQYDFGCYGPGSMTWKIGGEWAVLLGGTRAVLMQLAHPLVALGVNNHSSYMTDAFGRAERTFFRGEELSFGTSRIAHQAARTINNLHKQVHGQLTTDAGCFSQGTPYDARDPALLLWVHATLIDTVLLGYRLFVGPLTHAEEEQYYQESKLLAHFLGLQPAQMPTGIDDLKHYIHTIIYSDQLAPTLQARELAFQTLFPPSSAALRPLLHLNLTITKALLPQPVREIYGLEWGRRQQRIFDLSAGGMRQVIPHMPSRLRSLPITRRLMQGEIQSICVK